MTVGYVCAELRTIPGDRWIGWTAEERKTARAELRDLLLARLADAGMVPVTEVEEGARYDERHRDVTLHAEVWAGCATPPCTHTQGYSVGPA